MYFIFTWDYEMQVYVVDWEPEGTMGTMAIDRVQQ